MNKRTSLGAISVLFSIVSVSVADVKNGVKDMENVYRYIGIYKKNSLGQYPSSMSELRRDMKGRMLEYGYDDQDDFFADLKNPDIKLNPRYSSPEFKRLIPYFAVNKRPDGSPVGSPLRKGERDLVCYSDLYIIPYEYSYRGLTVNSEVGSWLVLWDDGLVETPPFDTRYYVGSFQSGFRKGFQRQALPGMNCFSYEEFNNIISNSLIPKPKVLGKDEVVEDNGGPENLVQLSRRANSPNIYGIDREALWQQFDPSQAEFTLSDVQAGATKLGLDTQVRKLPLSQLQASGSPALLFLKDDGRIVTLTALDADRAVVVDRGLTRNVERSVLEARYSGEALVPAKALGQNASIVADDAVRQVQLPSLEAEVPQSFTLRNTGKTPITLQLEYPLLGVTESKLSKDVLAPGETATLDLKVKWRSILKAPTQNVLVSIQTSDPVVPRLQLAVLLLPPKAN